MNSIPPAASPAEPASHSLCYFEGRGRISTPVYLLGNLKAGHEISGPSIVIDNTSTIIIEPDCKATITQYGDILIHVGMQIPGRVSVELDPIQLSVFSNRFMSIAGNGLFAQN